MGERPVALTIGTAGHVDHGKTTLVRRLTGTDTDRLEEEHRRGISIVPGYAELVLPGGRRASLVDVPGHERFVKNMVAGSTGVDAFLLVIAADDGVMPQTREHLDVLRILGVERGVVALSKIDAVDAETVELARLEAEEFLEESGIRVPIVPVSGVTGEGVDALLAALDELAESPAARLASGLVRLPVDRAFVLRGIGLVVTGTLWSGEIRVGDTLYTGSGLRPRVRGIQNHGRPAEVAYPGARTALDLVGIEAQEIGPGEVLLSRPILATGLFDARIRLLGPSRPLRHGSRVRLHHGTRSVNARIRLPGGGELEPGRDSYARVRLEEPLVLLRGDRFVLRSLAPQVTIGGGTVLDAAPAGRRPDPAWLEALESGDPVRIIPQALARAGGGMDVGELALVLGKEPEEAVSAAERVPGLVRAGPMYALRETLEEAKERLLETLERYAREHPESPELSVAEARQATGLPAALADALLEELSGSSEVRISSRGVSAAGAAGVPPELEAEARRLLEDLRGAGHEPPSLEPTPALALLLRWEEAVKVGESMYATREAAEKVIEEIKTACREEGGISLARLRDRLRTSRKYAQAWLEYADQRGVTVRTGDVRILTRKHRQ
ncbi:Selenocysteine-specific elongation factor [Rubrobacter xylanophilus DSM 9941]|uniref:selenocysteine-specific translation elongation factor n=1 Tax=Rubrobacter xylanophilus TaxID=49319 RepID=UPI001C6445C2|nr:selenocysteine-specific translation elongation factor [Rubrobacter xylanophilus]QYJ15121.1 Selenocysteine-specific elongation factor [Rubrobacter xylanophilus DSM 9941]